MVLWSINYTAALFLPLTVFYIVFAFDFFFSKKNQSLFFIVWTSGLINYYFIIFFLLNFFLANTNFILTGHSVTIYYVLPLIGYIYIYLLMQFFKKIVLFIPIYIFFFYISIPMFMSDDFFIYFISIEFISVILGFLFLKTSYDGKYTNALFNLILLNFLNLILLLLVYVFLLYFYGTADLWYVSILFNNSFGERVFFVIFIMVILLKLGQLPSFFYKKNIYIGLDFQQMVLYVLVYSVFIYVPSIILIWKILNILNYSYAVSFFVFFFLLNIFILVNNYSYEDFLVISSTIFILFLLLL